MFALIDMIIVNPIANILFVIYNFVGDFGLAIILFTVLVKLCMWPLMKRQLHQTKLMKKIQPELAEIKKNCKGNRQMESLQTMDLYKRYNVKPFRSILTLIIQLPIFIALYTAIRVMVIPTPNDNLSTRAYGFVQMMPRVNDIVEKQKPYLEDAANTEKPAEEKATYDFHPQLFGLVNLDPKPTDVFSNPSVSSFIILLFALGSAGLQYWVAKQQMPSNKKKGRGFKQILKEAAEGKEADQAELNNLTSGMTSKMMPIMMLLIMINLPGALVFYYFLTNLITIIQQKIIFARDDKEMEISADKAVLKELRDIKEAKVVPAKDDKNKKSKTNITRITAKDKKRRKK